LSAQTATFFSKAKDQFDKYISKCLDAEKIDKILSEIKNNLL
jgi:hypothetical protein